MTVTPVSAGRIFPLRRQGQHQRKPKRAKYPLPAALCQQSRAISAFLAAAGGNKRPAPPGWRERLLRAGAGGLAGYSPGSRMMLGERGDGTKKSI